jgi:uncharacterized protein (DUF983 family)
MGKLAGTAAIVTEASEGIEEGAAVAVNYASDADGAERVVREIRDAGGRADEVRADVSRAEEVTRRLVIPEFEGPTLRRVVQLVWRAIRLRCPNCGGGGLGRDYFHMRQVCPTCGLDLERGEAGYIVGAQMFNIIVAELVFAAIFVSVLVATLPNAPWALLQYGGMALMVVLPIVFYPFSKTTFLAFDLVFRPPRAEDFHHLY